MSKFGSKLDTYLLRTCSRFIMCVPDGSRKWGNVARQCAFSAVKANCTFKCVSKSVASRLGVDYLPLFSSPEDTFGVLCQVLGHQDKKVIDNLEKV